MSKNNYPGKHNTARVAVGLVWAGSLAIALSGCGAETDLTVDCQKSPEGVSKVDLRPGTEAEYLIGDARDNDEEGRRWQAKILVESSKSSFVVSADGFSSPGSTVEYSKIPSGDSTNQPFFVSADPETRKVEGYVDASVTNFDATNLQNPNNVVTVAYHCGPPNAGIYVETTTATIDPTPTP